MKPKHPVAAGEYIAVEVPEPGRAEAQPEAIPLSVLYEDDDLIVIDKAAGIVVHPAAGNPDGTLVNALLHHCGGRLSGIGGVARPGIVHRLDKETSGCLVAAKSDPAHRAIGRCSGRTMTKRYPASSRANPPPPPAASKTASAATPATASAWRSSPPAERTPPPRIRHPRDAAPRDARGVQPLTYAPTRSAST
ncbi:MAG: pseudouridine synthase [Verrucomicrobiales bacterium]